MNEEALRTARPQIVDTAYGFDSIGKVKRAYIAHGNRYLYVSEYNPATQQYKPYQRSSHEQLLLDGVDSMASSHDGGVVVVGGSETIVPGRSSNVILSYSTDGGRTMKTLNLDAQTERKPSPTITEGYRYVGGLVNIPGSDKFILGTRTSGTGDYGLQSLYIFDPNTESIRQVKGYDSAYGIVEMSQDNVFLVNGNLQVFSSDSNTFAGVRGITIDLDRKRVIDNDQFLRRYGYVEDMDVVTVNGEPSGVVALAANRVVTKDLGGEVEEIDYRKRLLKALRRTGGEVVLEVESSSIMSVERNIWMTGNYQTAGQHLRPFIASFPSGSNDFDSSEVDVRLPGFGYTIDQLQKVGYKGIKGVVATLHAKNLDAITFIASDSRGNPTSSVLYPDKGL